MSTLSVRVDVFHHFPHAEGAQLTRIEAAIINLTRRTMTDYTSLQTSLDALRDNVQNVVIPLLQKVANGSGDQATVDALAQEAKDVLGSLTGAEPAAPATGGAPDPAAA
jgi:pantothenate kinase-related protein Tda10